MTLLAINSIINVKTAFSNPITNAKGVTTMVSITNNEDETGHPRYLKLDLIMQDQYLAYRT